MEGEQNSPCLGKGRAVEWVRGVGQQARGTVNQWGGAADEISTWGPVEYTTVKLDSVSSRNIAVRESQLGTAEEETHRAGKTEKIRPLKSLRRKTLRMPV